MYSTIREGDLSKSPKTGGKAGVNSCEKKKYARRESSRVLHLCACDGFVFCFCESVLFLFLLCCVFVLFFSFFSLFYLLSAASCYYVSELVRVVRGTLCNTNRVALYL